MSRIIVLIFLAIALGCVGGHTESNAVFAQDGLPPAGGEVPPAQGEFRPYTNPDAQTPRQRGPYVPEQESGFAPGIGRGGFAGNSQSGVANAMKPVERRNSRGAPINLQALGLSEAQRQQIRQLRKKNSVTARQLRQSLRQKRQEMRALMFDPNATASQIRSKRHELRQMQDQMEDIQIEDFLSLRSVLTPEQRRRLPDIMPGRRSNVPETTAYPGN